MWRNLFSCYCSLNKCSKELFDYVVGIHRREEDFFEKENAVQGIRNSINEWNPESKFLRQVIRNPLCGIHPESKDVLDFPIWGDCSLVSKVRNTAIFKINHVVVFRFSYSKGEDGVPGTDGNPGNQGDTVSCLLVLIVLLKMFFCGSPCCSYKTVNILLSYFRDLVVCLEIQDHLEDLVHWYVVIIVIMMSSSMTSVRERKRVRVCLVVLKGTTHGCAGGEQIKGSLRYHDGVGHENVA